ncbi:hypothetical protein BC937DRAFT_90144 [Endogone sp. FLAS-F59071]|nr:hypothetical protein BC937DRAFT_90144 [Endogone sp. FLAS-F59071]|eukprot:RUS17310.1 hypothetical protein BC937DRAFT_90144 [Endogone sp. FLAS-F59071]
MLMMMRPPLFAQRSSTFLITRFVVVLTSFIRSIQALPAVTFLTEPEGHPRVDLGSEKFWWSISTMMFLVVLGGVFAGLTLGLMGLDETNLHVLMQSGEEEEKRHAAKVLALLERGKHWVLVTLLLSNVIVNETLPIILDSVFAGWQAVLISTALIVIFGEIIPQGKDFASSPSPDRLIHEILHARFKNTHISAEIPR